MRRHGNDIHARAGSCNSCPDSIELRFLLTVPRKEEEGEESDDSYLQIRHKTGEREMKGKGKARSHSRDDGGAAAHFHHRAHPSGFIVGGSGTSHNKRTRRLV